jgi:hypothetical protein
MNSRGTNGSGRQHELDLEIERYREAVVSALGQLEWIVGYLHKIHKPAIALALDRNRKQIVEEVGGRGAL